MNLKKIALIALGILLVAGFWLMWFCQPERQVRRHQKKLMSALEDHDYQEFGALFAETYRDRWGHDKAFVQTQVKDIFRQFLTLVIKREPVALSPEAGNWRLEESIKLDGNAVGIAPIVKERVNALKGPFIFTWQQTGSKPWNWVLISVDHAELEMAGGY